MKVKEAIETLQKATANCAVGDRHIVVLDRGWIFAGNLSKDERGVYTLTDAVNIRKWKQGGFGALSRSAGEAGATLDPSADIRFTEMIFAVPITESWSDGC